MNLRRFLRPEAIRLELRTVPTPQENKDENSPAYLERIRDSVLWELVELFAQTGNIVNQSKLFVDLRNREKRASTAVGEGVALPHVRTMQARTFTMAFARSTPGLPFGAPDSQPVHIFFGLVAPPYDDRIYLKVYRELGPLLLNPDWRAELMAAQDPHRVLRLLELVRR